MFSVICHTQNLCVGTCVFISFVLAMMMAPYSSSCFWSCIIGISANFPYVLLRLTLFIVAMAFYSNYFWNCLWVDCAIALYTEVYPGCNVIVSCSCWQ